MCFSDHTYYSFNSNSLTLLSDVARPDKISGADINAICQEVSCHNNCYSDTMMLAVESTNFIVLIFIGWYAGSA